MEDDTNACVASRAKIRLERWFREGPLADTATDADIFTPDVILHCPSGVIDGLVALDAAVRDVQALDGLSARFEVEAEYDQLVATFVLRGRHSCPLWGAEPTGELIEIEGIATLRIVADRVAELWYTSTIRHPDRSGPRARRGREELLETPWARRWRLTLREACVAELAMHGYGDKKIAAELELATASVSKYVHRILRKAGVASRSVLAERAGLLRIG